MKIVARIIFEVMGSPKDYVEQTMKDVINKLSSDKKIKIRNYNTYDAVQMDNKKMWSTYSEVELETEKMNNLLEICFDYMPSTLEILEPAGMNIDTNDISNLMNDLLSKLHNFTMLIHKLKAEIKRSNKKLDALENYTKILIKKSGENFKINNLESSKPNK